MPNNDFLSQFSEENKPDSFKEEKRIPIQKERKPLNVKLLIVILAIIAVLGVVGYFLFLAPKIEMPNFIGKQAKDVSAWVKQQGIQTSGILFEQKYDFNTDEDTVLSQSVEEGKKIKENAKLTFVISMGADPDEIIKVPDLENMEKDEIQAWINKNKLSKTKLTSAYDDSIAESKVISITYTGCDADSFTRSSNLKIVVSKGMEPAGKITVENFVGKYVDEVESWAKNKKITLKKTEDYSDKFVEGQVISQSIASGKTIAENATLEITISLGKAVVVPNMYEWTETEISRWCNTNGIIMGTVSYRYSEEAKGECIGQSCSANNILTSGEYLDVTMSLGDPDISQAGTSFSSLQAWISDVNSKGAGVKLGSVTYEISDSVAMNDLLMCSNKVKCGGTINCVVSNGKNILLTPQDVSGSLLSWDDVVANPKAYTEAQVRELVQDNGVNYVISYTANDTVEVGHVIAIDRTSLRSEDKELKSNSYIPECENIIIVICDK